MTEKLLQFIWQHKLFNVTAITQATLGQNIEVVSVGNINLQDGPDFSNAKIKIDETLWVGNVELHTHASDWHKHKHSQNPNYNNIIAHVVYEADAEIKDHLGNTIPCIELKNAIDSNLLHRYQDLQMQLSPIACAKTIANVKSLVQLQQWDKVVIERILLKSADMQSLLEQTNNNWSEVFYLSVAKVFGGNINGTTFLALATRLPLNILSKHKHNILQLEALLFGVAGLLDSKSQEPYMQGLFSEFEFLQKKYKLQCMEPIRWKFMRTRPQNFPTVRIAQFANLIHRSSFLFSAIISKFMHADALQQLFRCEASGFWSTHYTFTGEAHPPKPKNIGLSQIQNILINAIAPTLYVYGKQVDSEKHHQYAIQLLQYLPPEKNKITKMYEALNCSNENAFMSQAFIQQYKYYCEPKRCLACSIGFSILKGSKAIG